MTALAGRELLHVEDDGERCFCDRPAAASCECCQRMRCAEHVASGLCARCARAVDRAYAGSANTRWAIGTITIVIAVVEGVIAGSAFYLLFALPLGLIAGWAVGQLQRARHISALGAEMSETTDEQEAAQVRDAAFGDAAADAPDEDSFDGHYGYDGHDAHGGGHDGH